MTEPRPICPDCGRERTMARCVYCGRIACPACLAADSSGWCAHCVARGIWALDTFYRATFPWLDTSLPARYNEEQAG